MSRQIEKSRRGAKITEVTQRSACVALRVTSVLPVPLCEFSIAPTRTIP